MSEVEDTAAPAGDGSLSQDAAASLIQTSLLPQEEETPAVEAEPSPEEAQAPEPAQEEESPAPEAEPEKAAETEDEWVHGNAKTRLRDGREVRVSELKRLADIEPDLKRQEQELQARKSQLEAATAQIAQQYQIVQNTLPRIIEQMQAQIPAMPEPPTAELASTDPFKFAEEMGKYVSAKDARDRKIAQLQELNQRNAQQQALAHQQLQMQQQAWISEQRSKLYERAPELKDPAKARELQADAVKYGVGYYGFQENEIANITDARTLLALRDAVAYRKQQEQKPKVIAAKTKEAPPVKTPGRRVSEAETKDSAYKEQLAKLRKSGRSEDAQSIIMQMLG